ncbi:hypothetical protein ESZ50_11110 [Weissella muntiaci]|uniref:Uncharacterized protein n=1 Tax=Weissella muntiaci TaxID=2508881 RepID=A0A6C2C2C4_9LACO|nr:hypothetical protein [Weissella muntiaci]TYC47829.1 hypothetical protein ESZ50_11110 [Weissella muntiaci]
MSRSYKKPYFVDKDRRNSRHKIQNRKVRAQMKTGKYDGYSSLDFKKMNSSWFICDYRFYSPEFKEAYRK